MNYLNHLFNDWHPHTLIHCYDSPEVAWITAGLALSVSVWYILICERWYSAAKCSSPVARKTWNWLIVIFLACALGSYGSLVISTLFPATAIILRLAFLVALNIACAIFLINATKSRLVALSKNENSGFVLTKPSQLTDKDLERLIRIFTFESIQRRNAADRKRSDARG